MPTYKVLVSESRHGTHEQEKRLLAEIDAEVVIDTTGSEVRLAELSKDVDGLIVNLAPVTAAVIKGMEKCKCISRYGVGYDNIDIDALKQTDIMLANVPGYCAEDVSDHAMALLLDSVRKISRKDRLVREGKWDLIDIQKVYRLEGSTMGLIGYGNIARCLHRKLSGFNLGRVLVTDPILTDEQAKEAGVERVDLETLCRESDYISMHAPVLPETEGMMGIEQFSWMKETAIFINTARGPLVDEDALSNALISREIACAGLDVYNSEPLDEGSDLRRLANVTLTDHASWYSVESIDELKTRAAQNIVDALTKGKPTYPVEL